MRKFDIADQVRLGAGVYHANITADQSGHWYYRWAGTGALVVAEEGQFYVRQRRV